MFGMVRESIGAEEAGRPIRDYAHARPGWVEPKYLSEKLGARTLVRQNSGARTLVRLMSGLKSALRYSDRFLGFRLARARGDGVRNAGHCFGWRRAA
jgi:hypothetical protein